ncbi:hypothetical protein SPRG_03542 [Saprolegnia parasitica CBS 223.65]|uniref:Phosphatidylinositol-specific phospholipase C X domain-containing protein n=1 Tax=Saprolegnia parasitica (strain CBS 223.65) TaxID=695850 RepID=A0A067CXV5_SAPPC|nr:hypothetical protein SPRG_03542 [Saprolegnia parasitica CBS 223.65]KDO31622.1 hypothetical protein SPRG_03542 [Saprolegnia parasitica CBS 223.65]|eukprot:XP_012197512.1 hypothetical protein SPRG_03542 [Saprolegnia parasitica CBS 223.65]
MGLAEEGGLPAAMHSSIDLGLYVFLLSVFMVFFFFKHCQAATDDVFTTEATRWMTHADPALLAMPLNRIALAGSHNSGSYASRAHEKCHSGDCDANLAKYIRLPPVSFVVKRWAKCQRVSILHQLLHGIRYLDIRLQIHETSIHLCHSLCFLEVSCMLDQLVTFLDAHPQELVVVDINHIYTHEDEGHARFLHLFVSRVGRSRIATPSSHTPGSTLDAFRNAGVQVVLIYHEPAPAAAANVWGPDTIVSVWPNVPTAEDVMEHGKGQLLEEVSDDEPRLRVLQMLPTPSGKDLTRFTSVLRFSGAMVRLAPSWLLSLCAEHAPALRRCNIVLMDDAVHGGNAFVEALLELNRIKIKASSTVDVTISDRKAE